MWWYHWIWAWVVTVLLIAVSLLLHLSQISLAVGKVFCVLSLVFQTFCLFNIDPDMILFTSLFPDIPKGERPGDFCFPAMQPTAVLPANLLIFLACMQEVSGAVTLQQVPEAHKKKKETRTHQLHHHTFNNSRTHTHRKRTKVQRHKLTLCDPRAVVMFQPL